MSTSERLQVVDGQVVTGGGNVSANRSTQLQRDAQGIPIIPRNRPRPVGAPPETLSKEDSMRLNDVRKELWTGGFKGLASGLVAGYLSSVIGKRCLRFDRIPDL